MTSLTFVLLSGTLTFGVPVALAMWELLTIRTVAHGDEPPADEPFVPAPRPLPACLLPADRGAITSTQIRILEGA